MDDWITTEQAADLLCCEQRTLYQARMAVLRRRSRGASPRGAGWLYYRPDVLRLRAIMRGTGFTIGKALRVLARERALEDDAAALIYARP